MCETDQVCEVLKSNRGNLKLYIDGYTYEKNKQTKAVVYWFCESRRKTRCKGTAITRTDDDCNHFLTKKPGKHNHPKNPIRKQLADFKEKLREGVSAGIDTCNLINDSQANAAFDVLEHLPSTNALRQLIYRQRSKQKDTSFEEIYLSNKSSSSKMKRARNVNSAQMNQLLELLGEDGVMVDGRISYSDTTKLDFWKQIAANLNSIEGGATKNAWQWCKVWSDWKNRTQKKANILLKRKSYNLLDQPMNLNVASIEMKLLKLIGYPLDDKEDLIQLEMMQQVTKTEAPDAVDDHAQDYFFDNFMLQSDKEDGSDREDHNFEDNGDQFLDDIHNEDRSNGDKLFELPMDVLESEESDGDRKRRRSNRVTGHKTKKKKISIQDYRLKAQIELQKERQDQKKEELRLRAIELKLKGDELRLKEMEMNKVKYLTNIEEEKLKCFKEISASLKEFLEMSRAGNLRLHNVI